MMDGFDLDSALVCEGIVGDGCGGGRIFYIENEKLLAYDQVSKESLVLLEGMQNVKSIAKSHCIIRLQFEDSTAAFDLSTNILTAVT